MDNGIAVVLDNAVKGASASPFQTPTPPRPAAPQESKDAAPAKPSSSASATASKTRSLAAGQVNRVVDAALPAGMSVSRDARIALQKCATISVLYLACLADAERKSGGSSRTTLNVQDIRAALEAAGMAHVVPLMTTAAKRSRD